METYFSRKGGYYLIKVFNFFLEIIRITLILFVGLLVLGFLEQLIVKLLGFTNFNWIMFFIADFLLIYIVYKNKLQFMGWFNSNQNIPLSKQKTKFLILISIFLLALGLIYNIII